MSTAARTAAIVCEGVTDVRIFEGIMGKLWPEVETVLTLQPEIDALDKPRPGGSRGWSGVKAWCERNAGQLDAIISPPLGDPIDLLIIALDLDIAVAAGIADPPVSVSSYDASRLCDSVKSWLTPARARRLPREVVIALPAMAIESWVVAAVLPRVKRPEALAKPAELLATKGKLTRNMRGRPRKRIEDYELFGRQVARRLDAVRARCGEADRFCRKLEGHRKAVETGRA